MMIDLLDERVALKHDDHLVFNRDNVIDYLNQNQYLLLGFVIEEQAMNTMIYGYNHLGNPLKIGYFEGKIQRIIVKTKNYSSKRVKLTISYDGSNYHGFQIQNNKKTIQGELSKLVSEVNNHDVLVQGASRTDKGVHAHKQIVHFDDASNLSPEDWKRFLNHRLNKDIYVKSVELVHPLFHSRYDVEKKEYVYKIKLGDYDPFLLRYTWHQEYIDFVRLDDQLKKIIGKHDFKSFSKGAKDDTFRIIYDSGYKMDDEILEIHIIGNGFLRYMVRLLVSHCINYATKKTNKDILDIIKEKSRVSTKEMAPASGLYLHNIFH
jgi:tRNA pseudouridine38-40 synthase